MKKSIIIMIFLIAGCGVQLPDQYENVEKLRALAITFDNDGYAEAAPGDTVSVRGYFGGDTVRSMYWSISNQLLAGSFFGPDTFVDSIPMEKVIIPGTYKTYFGNRTDSVEFSFTIPPDVIRRNLVLDKPVVTLFPETISDSLKRAFGSITTGQMLDLLDLLSANPAMVNPAALNSILGSQLTMSQKELEQNLTILLQIFSIKLRVLVIENNYYKVRTFFTVRYNSKFKKAGINVEVNRRPLLEKVQLFKVNGHENSFNPERDFADVKKVYDLDNANDTVFIEKGYDYYLVARGPENVVDSGIDFTRGKISREFFYYKWFFRNDTDVPDVSQNELLKLPDITYDSSIVPMLPPLDKRMTQFSIWLCVYDDCLGTRLRPRGFTFKAMQGVFRYSDGW